MDCTQTGPKKFYITISSMAELLCGIIATIFASLLFYSVKTYHVYPLNVLFILKCSLASTILMTTTITLFAIYDIVSLFLKTGLGTIGSYLCFWGLLVNSDFSSVILLFYTVLIFERYIFVKNHQLQENKHVSCWIKFIIIVIIVLNTVILTIDMWQPEKIKLLMCDCSNRLFQTSFFQTMIFPNVYCCLLIFGTVVAYRLYKHYKNMYKKFTILLTTHNLQKRFELMIGKHVLMSLFSALLIMIFISISFAMIKLIWVLCHVPAE